MKSTKLQRIHHCLIVTRIGHAGFYLPVISAVNSALDEIKTLANSDSDVVHLVSAACISFSFGSWYLYQHLSAKEVEHVLRLVSGASNNISLSDIFEELDKEVRDNDLVLITFISELRNTDWNNHKIVFYDRKGPEELEPLFEKYVSKGWKIAILAYGNCVDDFTNRSLFNTISISKIISLHPYIEQFYENGQPYPNEYNYNPVPLNYIKIWMK